MARRRDCMADSAVINVHNVQPSRQSTRGIEKMSDYPRLAEMGVLSFDQIAGYTVNSLGYTDFLRIDYDRPKDSFLPVRRTYEFPRAQKKTSSGIAELKTLVSARESKKGVAACILDEVQRLEDETAAHCARIRELVGKLD